MDFFNDIILSTENLKNNLKVIKKQAGNKKICAMVKANAYGHDLKFTVLNLKNDVDFFGVANSVEALEVRKYAQKNKILVCGKVDKEKIVELVENNISLTVYSLKSLLEIIYAVKNFNKINKIKQDKELDEKTNNNPIFTVNQKSIKAKVHIKLNTGMNRLGFKTIGGFLKTLEIIEKYKRFVTLEGVYSHLFNCDNIGLVHMQYNRFLKFLNCINIYNDKLMLEHKSIDKDVKIIGNKKYKLLNKYAKNNNEETVQNAKHCEKKLIDFKNLIIHIENSGGLFNNADYLNVCNMARIGIAFFGLEIKGYGLKPVMSVKSKMVAIQKVKQEDYCGYGKVVLDFDGTVAVVPIGYADGIIKGYKDYFVTINKKPCKILNVCMDSIIIDVTNLPVKIGDEVIIISNNNLSVNSANKIAKHLGTISYEVVTNINHTRFNTIIN